MPREVHPRYGKQTIQLSVRLYADDMDGRGNYWQKHAWDRGTVYTIKNEDLGIESHQSHFNSLAELPLAVEKLLIKAGVTIHTSVRGSKYLTSQ